MCRSWCRWTTGVLRRLSALRASEAQRAKRAAEELEAKREQLAQATSDAHVINAANSLWSDDELPAMLECLSRAADEAEAAAVQSTGLHASSGTERRHEAAVNAASWQGKQLSLTVAVLDSLKRELARERAALASVRADAKQSDMVAERALSMLQSLREEVPAPATRTMPHGPCHMNHATRTMPHGPCHMNHAHAPTAQGGGASPYRAPPPMPWPDPSLLHPIPRCFEIPRDDAPRCPEISRDDTPRCPETPWRCPEMPWDAPRRAGAQRIVPRCAKTPR